MKLQAKHNLLLPDGKTEVKIGEIFEYEGDITSFQECVSVVSFGEKKEKEPKDPETETEEKALREKARLLGIKSYHNMNIEKLKAKIEEKEAEVEKGADNTPAPAHESAPAHVEEPETPEEGEGNV